MTLALIEPKLEEHGIEAKDRLKTVKPRERVTIGPFTIEFLRVTHSMPSILAEISFLTNPQEAALLRGTAYRQQIAEALFHGIMRYQRSLKTDATVASQ